MSTKYTHDDAVQLVILARLQRFLKGVLMLYTTNPPALKVFLDCDDPPTFEIILNDRNNVKNVPSLTALCQDLMPFAGSSLVIRASLTAVFSGNTPQPSTWVPIIIRFELPGLRRTLQSFVIAETWHDLPAFDRMWIHVHGWLNTIEVELTELRELASAADIIEKHYGG